MTDFPGGESGGRVHGVRTAPPPPCGDLRLSNATGIRKNGPLDFNGLDSNHHALLEVERGGGRVYPLAVFPALFSFRYPHNLNAWNMLDKEKPLFL